MKRITYTIFTLLLSFTFAIGQTNLIVEPGDVGTLNNAIFGDTTATGERIDSNRVYVLRKNFPYVISSQIRFGFNLTIRAEDAEGKMPLLIVDSGDGTLDQIFRTSGSANLTFDGLHISAKDILGANINRVVRISSDNSVIRINNCLIEEAGQAMIRVQGDDPKIFITNSIIRNIGRPSNPDNGRVIDNRGNPIDTLCIQNNVIYNVTSRIYRPSSGSAKHIKIDQNTIYGVGQHGFTFDAVEELILTNNLVYNNFFLGTTKDAQDTLEMANFMLEIDTFDAMVNNYVISHNNFHLDQELIDTIPEVGQYGEGDSLVSLENFVYSLSAQAAITAAGTGDTNINEELTFDNPPPFPYQFIFTERIDTAAEATAMPWDFSNLTKDDVWSAIGTGTIDRYSEAHDFSYSMDATSASAGTEGQPLGALTDNFTDVEDLFVANRILYYPNPTRSHLIIQNLDDLDLHQVAIYNLAGQLIQLRTNVNQSILELNVSNLVKGNYILSLIDTNGNISSRKFCEAVSSTEFQK